MFEWHTGQDDSDVTIDLTDSEETIDLLDSEDSADSEDTEDTIDLTYYYEHDLQEEKKDTELVSENEVPSPKRHNTRRASYGSEDEFKDCHR